MIFKRLMKRKNVLLYLLLTPVFAAIFVALSINFTSDDWKSWISATSGWAAAIAAFYTIQILVVQLKLQQDQTAFLVGDTPPTFDAFEHFDNGNPRVIIHVRNWNRRTLFLTRIQVIESKKILLTGCYIMDTELNWILRNPETFIDLTSDARVGGWVERDKQPPFQRFRLFARNAEEGSDNNPDWRGCMLEFQYSFVDNGELHKQRVRIYTAQ